MLTSHALLHKVLSSEPLNIVGILWQLNRSVQLFNNAPKTGLVGTFGEMHPKAPGFEFCSK